jgi:hypothetical protein
MTGRAKWPPVLVWCIAWAPSALEQSYATKQLVGDIQIQRAEVEATGDNL